MSGAPTISLIPELNRKRGQMPRKLRRSKALQMKRKKGRQLSAAVDVRSPIVPQIPKPVSPHKAPASGEARYPYVTAELRRIGILAGMMLVILVVLALVLA
jgi:hypothetical protein